MSAIALIFDFDDTLTPDSTSLFLEWMGIDVKEFWGKKVETLIQDNWDPIPAYLYAMIQESHAGQAITQQKIIEFADTLTFHSGVTRLFPHLKAETAKKHKNIELEFYLISSGIGDIVRNTKIAKYFTQIWSCEFAYNQQGEIEFPKNIISFTDKTRYVFQIEKGIIGAKAIANPFEVNRKYEQVRIPMNQMIFVGDGYTDVPCFSLVNKGGGYSFGVYNPQNREKLGRAWGFIEQGRVSNLHSANYRKGSDLCNSLEMAIDSIARRITK